MKRIKDELRNIIIGNGQLGNTSQIKKIQNFLRRYAETSVGTKNKKYLKSEEEINLIDFAKGENLLDILNISEDLFISAGAEQRVYRYDDFSVIKLNGSIFYEYWLDYFNSLLIHNYFFKSTEYNFLGFKLIDNQLFAIVKQDYIIANEPTDLNVVKKLLTYNNFDNTRNHDYVNHNLGIIFEDLHDENVLSNDGVLYFIDTIFYLNNNF